MEIRSVNNARIKEWCKLHEKKHREKQQKFLIENEHLIREAMQAQLLDTLILREDCELSFDFEGEVIVVSQEVMNKLKMNVSCPDCMGVCHMPKVSAHLGNRIICCDDVQDPGNVGTMIRSAHSFGFDTCIVSDRSVDLYNEK